MKFTFPLPGPLEGVKSRSKIVLRMSNVTFTYPTKDKPTIMDINLTCSQMSRVAVIGANGAGKSTAIKVFVWGNDAAGRNNLEGGRLENGIRCTACLPSSGKAHGQDPCTVHYVALRWER